uniref:Uncharacterized protein n=1 Tax=Romanomermis culicivorax TaxID=13658 RepID=A0A915JLC5_ROMCU
MSLISGTGWRKTWLPRWAGGSVA